jgi:hypothetical protein
LASLLRGRPASVWTRRNAYHGPEENDQPWKVLACRCMSSRSDADGNDDA